MKRYNSTHHQCYSGEVVPNCEVKLVRQSIGDFHAANDDLVGTSVYGTPSPNANFSIQFDNLNIDTYIFATKDHQYFQAMTRDQLGGGMVSPTQYYDNQERSFRSIEPGFTQWQEGSAKMYFRTNCCIEDPYIGITDHWPRETNKIMYAEISAGGSNLHLHHLLAHGGLQVYVLTKGNYQDCIIDGYVGEFQNGLYVLKESLA